MDGMHSADELTLNFLASIEDERFLALQRATGGYQGARTRNLNQMLDAFYVWCAEYIGAYAFVTTDYKLVRMMAQNSIRLRTSVLGPKELLRKLRGDGHLSLRDVLRYRYSMASALAATYRGREREVSWPDIGVA
jgi:hypothetical protein